MSHIFAYMYDSIKWIIDIFYKSGTLCINYRSVPCLNNRCDSPVTTGWSGANPSEARNFNVSTAHAAYPAASASSSSSLSLARSAWSSQTFCRHFFSSSVTLLSELCICQKGENSFLYFLDLNTNLRNLFALVNSTYMCVNVCMC